jgi:hypothetical protein
MPDTIIRVAAVLHTEFACCCCSYLPLQMITVADYLGADLCLKASAISLSEMPIEQHSVLEVCSVMHKVRSCCAVVAGKLQDALIEGLDRILRSQDTDIAGAEKLQEALLHCLLDRYGDGLAIINNDELLFSFCKLPLSSIELWGSSDKLKVDSENTVVVLLNMWWNSQENKIQKEECQWKLSALVRVAFLSNGYLQYALPELDWFIAPFPKYVYACSIVNTVGIAALENAEPFDQLNLTHRCSASQTQLHVEWRLPFAQVQQAVTSCANWCIHGPEGYWQGHMWSVMLQCGEEGEQGEETECVVGITQRPANSMPQGIPASAKIAVQGEPFNEVWKQLMFRDGQVWCVDKTSDGEVEVTLRALQHHLTDDNHLIITVTINNVW